MNKFALFLLFFIIFNGCTTNKIEKFTIDAVKADVENQNRNKKGEYEIKIKGLSFKENKCVEIGQDKEHYTIVNAKEETTFFKEGSPSFKTNHVIEYRCSVVENAYGDLHIDQMSGFALE